MSEEQLKAFLEAVKADAGLQHKLKNADNSDAVAAIAHEEGFAISADMLKSKATISDAELEGVAGGGTNMSVILICNEPTVINEPPIPQRPTPETI